MHPERAYNDRKHLSRVLGVAQDICFCVQDKTERRGQAMYTCCSAIKCKDCLWYALVRHAAQACAKNPCNAHLQPPTSEQQYCGAGCGARMLPACMSCTHSVLAVFICKRNKGS
jgi:hypothetical protein